MMVLSDENINFYLPFEEVFATLGLTQIIHTLYLFMVMKNIKPLSDCNNMDKYLNQFTIYNSLCTTIKKNQKEISIKFI